MSIQFEGFQKIPRWSRDVTITEKVDGTNAQIYICLEDNPEGFPSAEPVAQVDNCVIFAGSRNRWITPERDNYGFAGWVREHALPLRALGPGKHFGEWYGRGIQRRYGLTEQRLALFNVGRWTTAEGVGNRTNLPECVQIVPVMYKGALTDTVVQECIDELSLCGSRIVPGFRDPEGIVIYHSASKQLFKKTCKDDAYRKGNVVSEKQEAYELAPPAPHRNMTVRDARCGSINKFCGMRDPIPAIVA